MRFGGLDSVLAPNRNPTICKDFDKALTAACIAQRSIFVVTSR